MRLVLIEQTATRGTRAEGALQHLGLEVGNSAAVPVPSPRLSGEGWPTRVEESRHCCFGLHDKLWVEAPEEAYTVLADSPIATSLSGDARGCSTSESVEPGAGSRAAIGYC
ncbi:MAG TPA: hypothetical protein VNH38_02630 [Candidatus Dormibacteraeota bacterium]|nr:hypothetical protein [Candidatus Dormibacteraeota bacterium]